MAKSGPKNNYSSSDNYGANTGDLDSSTTGTQNYVSTSMYTDNHYMDGDGALYWTGMIAQRVLVKGDAAGDLTSGGGLKWTIPSGQTSATAATLGIKTYSGTTGWSSALRIDTNGIFVPLNNNHFSQGSSGTSIRLATDSSVASSNYNFQGIVNYGVAVSSGAPEGIAVPFYKGHFRRQSSTSAVELNLASLSGITYDSTSSYSGIKINTGQGISVGNNSQDTANYNKVFVDLYKSNIGTVQEPNYENMSGLEFSANTFDGQLRVMLDSISGGSGNVSGLEIVAPYSIGSGASQFDFTGGLRVNYGTGLQINASTGALEVDTSAIVPNITGTDPITVTTSGTNKVISVKDASTSQKGVVKLYPIPDGTTTTGINENNSTDALTAAALFGTYGVVGDGLKYNEHHLEVDKSTTVTNGDTKPVTSDAVYDYVTGVVSQLEALDLHFEIFTQLPTASSTYKSTIALVAFSPSPSSGLDYYKQYACIEVSTNNWRWEEIGDTEFTTANFVQKTDVLSQADISAIVTDVFGF